MFRELNPTLLTEEHFQDLALKMICNLVDHNNKIAYRRAFVGMRYRLLENNDKTRMQLVQYLKKISENHNAVINFFFQYHVGGVKMKDFVVDHEICYSYSFFRDVVAKLSLRLGEDLAAGLNAPSWQALKRAERLQSMINNIVIES